MDLTSVLAELSKEEKSDPCIAHALKLRTAWSLRNYKRFLQLYEKSPKMSGYLIDWFLERERKAALKIIIKAYSPSYVPIKFVQKQLGFYPSEQEIWQKFVDQFNLTYLDKDRLKIDCKASVISTKTV